MLTVGPFKSAWQILLLSYVFIDFYCTFVRLTHLVANCFDGHVVGNETCDEGSAIPTGGCIDCQRTPGWNCLYDTTLVRSVCTRK
jgi:hypothetical protein